MKSLLVCRAFNKSGGISRYCVELAERFSKEHEIHLLTSMYDYPMEDIVVHKKPIVKNPFCLQIASNVYYNKKYIDIIKRDSPGIIIHSQGTESLKCDVLTMHSCHKAWVKQHIREKNRKFTVNPTDYVRLTIEKRVVEHGCKKIISVSEGVKLEILDNYNVPADKIIVIPNGVDLNEFYQDKLKRREIRSTLNINESDVVMMFSGHEFKRKGLEYIIKSLKDVDDNIKLLVVGKDDTKPYKELASKLDVSDRILFAGFVTDIQGYYSASDIFVFPTAYEAFSLATLEAVASSLPILATKVNGTEELIRDGYNGSFISRDPKDIAEKINAVVGDEGLMRKMGANARKTAENYSWDNVSKRTLKVYENFA